MAYGFNEDKSKAEIPDIVIEEKSGHTSTIAKSTTGYIEVSVNVAKTGYTPVAIVGFDIQYGGGQVRWALWGEPFTFGGFEIDGNNAKIKYCKYKSASEAGALYADMKILYRKNV